MEKKAQNKLETREFVWERDEISSARENLVCVFSFAVSHTQSNGFSCCYSRYFFILYNSAILCASRGKGREGRHGNVQEKIISHEHDDDSDEIYMDITRSEKNKLARERTEKLENPELSETKDFGAQTENLYRCKFADDDEKFCELFSTTWRISFCVFDWFFFSSLMAQLRIVSFDLHTSLHVSHCWCIKIDSYDDNVPDNLTKWWVAKIENYNGILFCSAETDSGSLMLIKIKRVNETSTSISFFSLE